MRARQPELLARLYEPFWWDRQAEHEAADGFANVGEAFGFSMRPASPFYQRVLELSPDDLRAQAALY